MGTMVCQITSLTIIYSAAYTGTYQINHQSSASLAFVRGIHHWLVNFPHKWPVTRKMFPLYDVIIFVLFISRVLTNGFKFACRRSAATVQWHYMSFSVCAPDTPNIQGMNHESCLIALTTMKPLNNNNEAIKNNNQTIKTHTTVSLKM